jgi:hypothetical protein
MIAIFTSVNAQAVWNASTTPTFFLPASQSALLWLAGEGRVRGRG